MPPPPLGRDLQVPASQEEASLMRDYINHMSFEDIEAQATEWWDKLESRRLLAEDEEFQALNVWEEEDERALARRVYRKRVIRSLLAKGHTPPDQTLSFLTWRKLWKTLLGPPMGHGTNYG